jgi:transposase InsO family protein
LKREGLLTHRSKAKAPERKRPAEITAIAPNQVWSWDISYLLTLSRGVYLYLYLILDIWDRSVVGWAIHAVESGELAAVLLRETCIRQSVEPGALTVHQDNGGPMISGEFLGALSYWGEPSYSRPGVCDDNPFSESLFRTLKYRPGYPERFETIDDAKDWIRKFTDWYNTAHRHSGIGFVTPQQRRSGADIAILETRRATYQAARAAHPSRWSGDIRKWNRPESVTLNPRRAKKDRHQEAA